MIPLEDLPETQVGFGFGLAKGPPVKKPAYLKVTKVQQIGLSKNPEDNLL